MRQANATEAPLGRPPTAIKGSPGEAGAVAPPEIGPLGGDDGEPGAGAPGVGADAPGRNTRLVTVPVRVTERISAVRNLLTKIESPSTITSRKPGSIVTT